MNEDKFHTERGYSQLRQDHTALTPSMEDYLEMVYRLAKEKGYTRVGDLARAINVKPPSASKMVHKLAEMSYLHYEKYGIIQLTGKGRDLGRYLINRHKAVERFLEIIGVTEDRLRETETIEHNISQETMERIKILVAFMRDNPQIIEDFKLYQRARMKQKE